MKPGKFILDWEFKIVDLYDLQTNKCLIELDKRFIDKEDEQEITKKYLELNLKDDYKAMKDLILAKYKEELKDKIKKLNYSLDIRDKMPYKQKIYLEEILELIDK